MALQLGRIVWTDIADANGIRKKRPAAIITPTERITPDGPLQVVAITSTLAQPLPDDHVLLPWQAQGHPRTKLKRKCAAVCSWRAEIRASDIEEEGGLIPGPLMLNILQKIADASSQGTKTEENGEAVV